ncbi:hypothetical protein RI367_003310 [Sorochytrium milnesiophthora]
MDNWARSGQAVTLLLYKHGNAVVTTGHYPNDAAQRNYILSLPFDQQELAVLLAPPPHIIMLFSRTPIDGGQHVQQLRDSMAFARDVLVASQNHAVILRAAMAHLDSQIGDFAHTLTVQQQALAAFETMLGPFDNVSAADIVLTIPDMEDVDHMDE